MLKFSSTSSSNFSIGASALMKRTIVNDHTLIGAAMSSTHLYMVTAGSCRDAGDTTNYTGTMLSAFQYYSITTSIILEGIQQCFDPSLLDQQLLNTGKVYQFKQIVTLGSMEVTLVFGETTEQKSFMLMNDVSHGD